MPDPSPIPSLAMDLPQSQTTRSTRSGIMNGGGRKINAAGVAATATRVLLRVKRRRPVPATTETATAGTASASVGVGIASEATALANDAPDRIRLAIDRIPPSDAAGSAKKRRRIGREVERALIERLDAVVSLCGSDVHRPAGGCDLGGDPPRTPPRRGSGSVGGNPNCGGEMTEDERPSTPPPHSPSMFAGRVDDASHDDVTPAPPTKPRRTVVFRKISDLQKRILLPSASSEEGTEINNNGAVMAVEGEARGDAALSLATTPPRAKWTSKGEERSKWLRVVDVTLKEDGACADQTPPKETNENIVAGSGQRVRRMRPRPLSDDAGAEERGEYEGSGGRGGKIKRRKMGWVVEQSRTVLESDFWNEPLSSPANASGNGNGGGILLGQRLDQSVSRLIDNSLQALHHQGGGTVSPHISFLKTHPGLNYTENTPQGRLMVDHALSSDVMSISGVSEAGIAEGRGRTALHYAALWGDLIGVKVILEMGADPTIFDAQGNTPAGLARRGGHNGVVAVLAEGERRAVAEKNIRDGSDDGEEYYYDVYCLEGGEGEAGGETRKVSASEGSSVEEKKDEGNKEDQLKAGDKPRFLRAKAHSAGSDTIPDLERSSVLTEEEYDDPSGRGGHCALIELQRGFGYWNEKGELVLESASSGNGAPNVDDPMKSPDDDVGDEDDRFVRRFYRDDISAAGDNDDDHDSNDEGYDGNDYPDDVSYGLDSDYDDYRDADAYGDVICSEEEDDDDDSVDGWRIDFRNRLVARGVLEGRRSGGGLGVDESHGGD